MKSVAPKTSNLRALATTWIVAALVLLAFEVAARVKPQPVWEREEEQLLARQVDKIDHLAGGEVLLLGDSSLGCAIDARVLSEALGKPAVNLALVASFTTFGDFYLLQHALDRGHVPSAIVLFHTVDLWPRGFADDRFQLVQRATGHVGLETASRDLASQLALAQQSKAWKLLAFDYRHGIEVDRSRLEHELEKSEAARRILPERDYIPLAPVRDWAAQEARIASGAGQVALINSIDASGRFQVDPHVERWLDATVELAREHHVPVFVAVGPLWRPRAARAENRAYLRELVAWLDAKSKPPSALRRLWTPSLVVGSEWVGDNPQHLGVPAMEPFTRWFAQRLRAALAGEPDMRIQGELWDPMRDEPVVLE